MSETTSMMDATKTIQLRTYTLIPRDPLRDPMGLSGTRVTSPSAGEVFSLVVSAGEYDLLGLTPRYIRSLYTVKPGAEVPFTGTRQDWIEAIGWSINDPVVFPVAPKAARTGARKPVRIKRRNHGARRLLAAIVGLAAAGASLISLLYLHDPLSALLPGVLATLSVAYIFLPRRLN